MSYFDDPANDVTAFEAEFQDRWTPLATPGDAHREWHLNSGVPMGTPGCPQDACHPVDEDFCCENAEGEGTNDIHRMAHNGDCDNYDGAPSHQWEVTTPADVWFTDEDYDDGIPF